MLTRRMMFSILVCLATAGCQTTVPSRERPLSSPQVAGPIYVLPSEVDYSALEIALVLASQAPKPTNTIPSQPVAAAQSIESEGTTAPRLRVSSTPILADVLKELPENLPFDVVFLISSQGEVAEAVFVRAHNHPDERPFAARLRSLRFKAATHDGVPITVIVGMDLRKIGHPAD